MAHIPTQHILDLSRAHAAHILRSPPWN
jgi:hypothetical protein